MNKLVCRDDPVFDAGIKKMIEEMAIMSITEYVNAIIFFKKNKKIDPEDSRAIERRRIIRDCEEFFLYDYEYMTDKDGDMAMEQCRSVARDRESYVSRKWARMENDGKINRKISLAARKQSQGV